MPDLVVAATLQDVHEADDVAVNVGVGIGQRIANASLGREVDDTLGLEVGERLLQRGTIFQRGAHERETVLRRQSRQSRFLERRIVVVVEIVITQHFITACEQAMRQGRADKAGSAGNEDAHGGSVLLRIQRRSSTLARGNACFTSNRIASGLPSARILSAPISMN